MSSSNDLPKLSDSEIEIMKIIWSEEPATIREILSCLNQVRESSISRSTLITQIERLQTKGWVRKDDSLRPAKYQSTIGRSQATRKISSHLRNLLFDGSVSGLVKHLIGDAELSKEDIDELGELIREAKERS